MEAKMRKYFDDADVDKSGTLTRFELCKVLQRGGCKDSVEEISKWFDEIDVNNDDAMTFDEMWKALNKRDPAEVTECDLRSTFKELDADGSGNIDINELKQQFEAKGLDADVDAILESVDKDDDGKVNFEEFLACWKAG